MCVCLSLSSHSSLSLPLSLSPSRLKQPCVIPADLTPFNRGEGGVGGKRTTAETEAIFDEILTQLSEASSGLEEFNRSQRRHTTGQKTRLTLTESPATIDTRNLTVDSENLAVEPRNLTVNTRVPSLRRHTTGQKVHLVRAVSPSGFKGSTNGAKSPPNRIAGLTDSARSSRVGGGGPTVNVQRHTSGTESPTSGIRSPTDGTRNPTDRTRCHPTDLSEPAGAQLNFKGGSNIAGAVILRPPKPRFVAGDTPTKPRSCFVTGARRDEGEEGDEGEGREKARKMSLPEVTALPLSPGPSSIPSSADIMRHLSGSPRRPHPLLDVARQPDPTTKSLKLIVCMSRNKECLSTLVSYLCLPKFMAQ